MSNTLLPCPFCGGEAAARDIKEPSANGWVGCQRCRCFIEWVKNGKPQAIAAWNHRAEVEPVVQVSPKMMSELPAMAAATTTRRLKREGENWMRRGIKPTK